jgi:DNA helicase-2/ATP-dependent DNA helicase PcrA
VAILDAELRRIGAPQGVFVRDDRGAWHTSTADAARLSGGQGTAARPRSGPLGRLGMGADGLARVDKHLPEITALIDPKQFDVITQPSSGLVVIQGGAGSGKTTIALHRIAYLVFQDPKRFRPERMLVVVPHPALVAYTSRVLPSLGVEGVMVSTFEDWARDRRAAELPGLPRDVEEETPLAVSRLKKHPAMLVHLARRAEAFDREVETTLLGGTVHERGGDRVAAAWKALRGQDLAARLDGMRDWLAGRRELGGAGGGAGLDARTQHVASRLVSRARRRCRDVLGEWADALTSRAPLRAVFDEVDPGAVNDAELDELVRWCATRAAGLDPELGPRPVKPARDDGRAVGDGSDDQRERAAAADLDAEVDVPGPDPIPDDDDDPDSPQDDVDPYLAVDGRRDDEEPVRLDREDDALLLRIVQLRRGGLRRGKEPLRYEHLAIDEAQDLSPVELAVLVGTVSRGQSITMAGDTAQRLVLNSGFTDFPSVLRQLGLEHVAIEPLRIAYRSTREVLEVAMHVLGELAGPDRPVAPRSGAPVELYRHPDTGAAVAFLSEALRELAQAEPRASVGVIARYPAQAAQVFAGLRAAEVPNVRLVADADFTFRPGVDVTSVREVKGLEFDYVVIVDAGEATYPTDEESRYLLHIAMTRAAHQLWVLAPNRPSLLLPPELRERGW